MGRFLSALVLLDNSEIRKTPFKNLRTNLKSKKMKSDDHFWRVDWWRHATHLCWCPAACSFQYSSSSSRDPNSGGCGSPILGPAQTESGLPGHSARSLPVSQNKSCQNPMGHPSINLRIFKTSEWIRYINAHDVTVVFVWKSVSVISHYDLFNNTLLLINASRIEE